MFRVRRELQQSAAQKRSKMSGAAPGCLGEEVVLNVELLQLGEGGEQGFEALVLEFVM